MKYNPFETISETVDTQPDVSDEVKTTTCYMCACRCGIKVHLKNNEVRYIEGNPDHPVNKGILCAKGSAGIMQHNSPARLSKPLLRVGERGEGKFEEIEWEEALQLATNWLSEVRSDDPSKLAFFTGRDQSQSLTGWWATQFGTPNFAAHGGFCSVNMAAAGLYTIGGSFWEFGEPDWDLCRYFMMFGVAEDHDSNPIKAGIGRMKTREDAKFVAVNPVRTAYSAVADEWVGIRPGTDGLFIGALIQELLKAGKIDVEYLRNYTNASWLVIDDPGAADHGLFARDDSGEPLKRAGGKLSGAEQLPDGRQGRAAFEYLVERFMEDDYKPENAAKETGLTAETIRRIAAELAEAAFEKTIELDVQWTDWTGKVHDKMVGRPVSIHAMRGISAHTNGFHTCRMIHILQMLLGSIEVPGGMRYKAPFPKPIPPGPVPHSEYAPNSPLNGPPIGNPTGPEHLQVNDDGSPRRIDKAFSWENPLSIHGLMHMVLRNAWAGDPYKINVLFMYMANMAWNSSMNTAETLKYFTDKDPQTGQYKIPKIIYSDAYYSETVPYADLVLPDTTYLERWDCISLLDRPISSAHGPADSIRQPVVEPDRDVRAFQTVLLDLGARLGLPGMCNDDGSATFPGGYPDYIVNHERAPGIGPLAGWRGQEGESHGRGEPNDKQLEKYIENGCYWRHELAENQQYFKPFNKDYLAFAKEMGFIPNEQPIIMQVYDEIMQKFRLAAEGHGDHQPPETMRERVKTYFDPLPFWYPPFEGDMVDKESYPLSCIGQRPAHMYHSWGSMNAWLRQITNKNYLYMNPEKAKELELEDGDWVWVESHQGKIRAPIKLMQGTNPDTVWTWNAIGKRKGAWGLSDKAPEFKQGFLLNHLIGDMLPNQQGDYHYSNSDPVTGQASWFDLRVSVTKCSDDVSEVSPMFDKAGPGDVQALKVMKYTGGKK